MNKKGFTLVEILIVIALVGLLFGIGIPGVMKISKNMKERSYKTKVELIEQAAILWGQDNKTKLQTNNDCEIEGKTYSCHKIALSELIENDYLNSEKDNKYLDPRDNSDISNTCVYVYKKNNRVYSYFEKTNSCESMSVESSDDLNGYIEYNGVYIKYNGLYKYNQNGFSYIESDNTFRNGELTMDISVKDENSNNIEFKYFLKRDHDYYTKETFDNDINSCKNLLAQEFEDYQNCITNPDNICVTPCPNYIPIGPYIVVIVVNDERKLEFKITIEEDTIKYYLLYQKKLQEYNREQYEIWKNSGESTQTCSIECQMYENAIAWHNASDTEKETLHSNNNSLAARLGYDIYFSEDGYWRKNIDNSLVFNIDSELITKTE